MDGWGLRGERFLGCPHPLRDELGFPIFEYRWQDRLATWLACWAAVQARQGSVSGGDLYVKGYASL